MLQYSTDYKDWIVISIIFEGFLTIIACSDHDHDV